MTFVTVENYLSYFIFTQLVKPPLIFEVMSGIFRSIEVNFFFIHRISQQDYQAAVHTATGIDWVCTALVMLISVHSVLI